jgi:ferritin-like metal-binding protein YciE
MSINSLQNLFAGELSDLHSAGSQILKVLPKMAKASAAPELRQLFQTQIAEVRGQVERVERVSQTLGIAMTGKQCRGIEGLVEETEEMIAEREVSHALDAGLSLKVLRMQHYLLAAGNGASRTYALLALEIAQTSGQVWVTDLWSDELFELANHKNAFNTVH